MRARSLGAAVAVMLVMATLAGCTGRGGGGGGPAPASSAVAGGAIAVTDLARSVRFYTGLGMREQARGGQPGVEEVTLGFAGGTASLILQHHTDGRTPDARRWPGKLVFGAASTSAFASRIRAGGGQITSNAVIATFGRDPDGYLLEINGGSTDRINAFGVGASDLDRTEAFYQRVFGTRRTMSFNLQFREYVVQAPGGGPALALMHWVDGSPRNYQDNLGGLVFTSADAAATAAAVTAAGGQVVSQEGGTFIAKDLDGTVLEIRPR